MCCWTSRPVRVLLMVPLAEIWRERPQAEQNIACALLAAPQRSQKRVDESAMHLFFLCLDGVLWVRVGGCRLVHLYVICQGGIFWGALGVGSAVGVGAFGIYMVSVWVCMACYLTD